MRSSFSQRMGFTPLTKEIQLESMDDKLRIGLWNVFSLEFVSGFESNDFYKRQEMKVFGILLWRDSLDRKIETVPESFYAFRQNLHDWFFDRQTTWYSIYDFLEDAALAFQRVLEDTETVESFYDNANAILERNFSGYRFIDGVVAPITNEHEIKEIEMALDNAEKFTSLSGCNVHLSAALELLSDKTNPDYRNAIKESISAVEAAAKVIAGKPSAVLSSALDVLSNKAPLHKALVSGYKSIYGWTSDSDGIRHGLMDESTCDFDDAKYMLVSCSAFINYLISKAQKAGIEIK